MKVMQFTEYGGPDVLHPATWPDPMPGPGEVRIRIHAAGVNPVDAKIRKGLLQQRLPHQLPIIPGWDAAGVIDAVGSGVSQWNTGDAVFAYCRKPVVQCGAYAEAIILPETQIARAPKRLSMEEAAAVPLAALTAYQCLFGAAHLLAGQTVLIHAGAGGVGGYAIQLAKIAGANVVATGRQNNHEAMRALGADHVIDYTSVDFRAAVRALYPDGIDLAYDTVGGEVQSQSADVLRPGGTLVSILAFADEAGIVARGVHPRYVFVAPNQTELTRIAGWLDEGRLTVRLADVLPLEQAAEAHRLIESGRTAGKLVLRIRV
jgi:NADPH2:quinone reductase